MCLSDQWLASELHLLAFFSSSQLLLLVSLILHLGSIRNVLLLVQGGSALCINELVVGNQPLFGVRLELNQLLERDDLVLTVGVKPDLVDHLTVDSACVGKRIIVELQAHELGLRDEAKLSSQIWDLRWVHLQDHIKESCPITLALVELLGA